MRLDTGQGRDADLASEQGSSVARTATLTLGAIAILAALIFIGWDWFSVRNIEVWPEWETPWTQSVDFRFNVATPAFVEVTHSQYECIFDFPSVPKVPGKTEVTGVTVSLGLAGPLTAGSQKIFSCPPFVPANAGGKIFVRVLYAYHAHSIWFSSNGAAETPVYYWVPGQNCPSWEVQKDQQVLSALDRCRHDADPLHLCHGTMPDRPPIVGLSTWLVVR